MSASRERKRAARKLRRWHIRRSFGKPFRTFSRPIVILDDLHDRLRVWLEGGRIYDIRRSKVP